MAIGSVNSGVSSIPAPPVTAVNPLEWFISETMTYVVPQGSTGDDKLAWFLAQGWVVTATQFSSPPIVVPTSYTLKRNRIDASKALKSVVEEFTKAYNEGRAANSVRYDDLVSLLTASASQSTGDVNDVLAAEESFKGIIDSVLSGLTSDFNSYKSNMQGQVNSIGSGRTTDINQRFDNRRNEALSDLLNRGLYSATVRDSVLAGIERERARALSELAGEVAGRKVDVYDRIQSRRQTLADGIVAARDRLRQRLTSTTMAGIELRNSVLTALARAIEARVDSYPSMENLASIAAELGKADAIGPQAQIGS